MTTDKIMSFAQNVRNSEYGFLPAVLFALEEFEKKNNTPMYRLIGFVEGKAFVHADKDAAKALALVNNASKTDDAGTIKLTEYSAPLKRILGRAVSNVTFTFKKGKDGVIRPGVKVGDNGGVNHDVMDELRAELDHWNNRISVKSDLFKGMFPAVKATKKSEVKELTAAQVQASADRVAKDRTIDDLTVILENERKKLKALEALISNKQKAAAI